MSVVRDEAKLMLGVDDTSMHRALKVDATGVLQANLVGIISTDTAQPLSTATSQPFIESDFVYGNQAERTVTRTYNGASITASNSMLSLASRTNPAAQAVAQSRSRLCFRPGRPIQADLSVVFGSSVASQTMIAGLGHAEDGVYFCDTNGAFGLLLETDGVRAVVQMTTTNVSSHSQVATLELDGANYTGSISNTNFLKENAFEVSQIDTNGMWSASVNQQFVFFVAGAATPLTGAFSLTATSMTANFTTLVNGVAATSTFVPQASWNVDPLDGTGPSGITLDKTKLNRYSIEVLTPTEVVCSVWGPSSTGSWKKYSVHRFSTTNTTTLPIFKNPSFPVTVAVVNQGATTSGTMEVLTLSGSSFGPRSLLGYRYNISTIKPEVGTSYECLLAVQNAVVISGKANQTIVAATAISVSANNSGPLLIYLIRSTLAGVFKITHLFNLLPVGTNTSLIATVDSSAFTLTNDAQIVFTRTLNQPGSTDINFTPDDYIYLEPGEYLGLVAQTTAGTAGQVVGTLSLREY